MPVKAGTRLTYLFYGSGSAQRSSASWNQFHYQKIIAAEIWSNGGARPGIVYLTERLLFNTGESLRVYWGFQRKWALSITELSEAPTGRVLHKKWAISANIRKPRIAELRFLSKE